MKEKQRVKAKRLAEFEKAEVKSLHFEVADDAFKRLVIDTSIGPLEISLESYTVAIYETKPKKKYRITITDKKGVFPTVTKDFDEESERDSYTREVEDTYDNRLEIAISEYTEGFGEESKSAETEIPF